MFFCFFQDLILVKQLQGKDSSASGGAAATAAAAAKIAPVRAVALEAERARVIEAYRLERNLCIRAHT